MDDERFDDVKRDSISEDDKEKRWDSIHSRGGTRTEIRNQYDGWLEQDERIKDALNKCSTPILDLGCGIGIDTLHLVESGHRVIACDFSNTALEKVKENIPEARTIQFNMKNGIPFEKELFDVIIANKSIHYFTEKETEQLISELYRVIKPNGVFVFVVNSVNDSNFGAGQGIELEKDFYEVRETTKRFFSQESLEKFFDKEHWEFICMNESVIEDDRIKAVQLQDTGKPNRKVTWTCMVKRK